ncbi:MAG: hypothetical protein ABIB79_01960 [archaeon]
MKEGENYKIIRFYHGFEDISRIEKLIQEEIKDEDQEQIEIIRKFHTEFGITPFSGSNASTYGNPLGFIYVKRSEKYGIKFPSGKIEETNRINIEKEKFAKLVDF